MLNSSVSTKNVSKELMDEIRRALKNISGWGSVEIYIQDHKVVQITERNIRKTQHLSGFTEKNKNGVLTK